MKKLRDVQISVKQLAIALLLLGAIAAGGYWFFVLSPRPLVSDFEEGLRAYNTHTEARQHFREDLDRITVSPYDGKASDFQRISSDTTFVWLNSYTGLPEDPREYRYAAFANTYEAAMEKWPHTISVLIDDENDLIIGYLAQGD